jgi:hypothetical protein
MDDPQREKLGIVSKNYILEDLRISTMMNLLKEVFKKRKALLESAKFPFTRGK